MRHSYRKTDFRQGAVPDNKPVCKFWKQGNCRFGKDCKFRHEDDSGGNNNNNHGNNFNNNNNAGNTFRNNNNKQLNKHNPFILDKDAIRADLTQGEERPQWPLSAYGPGREAPLQLIEGPLEISPEEMRVQCYLAREEGKFDQYLEYQQSKENEAMARAAEIVRNIDEAIRYVQEGESRMENRRSQVTQGSTDFPKTPEGFGRPSQVAQPTGLSAYGHTSHAGQNPAFPLGRGSQGGFAQAQQAPLGGAPAFGQPTSIGSSAFGRPSQTGQPAFGQPSQPVQSSFGRPSQPAFGQPSQPNQPAFGQPSQPTQPAFGQPSQPTHPAFGQPSQPVRPAFGQPSQPNQSAFGQPSQPPQPAFGQPSNPSKSAFGQPSQPTFGQPTQTPLNPSPFDRPSQPSKTPFASAPNTTSTPQQPQQNPSTDPSQTQQQSNPSSGDPDAEGPSSAYEGPLGQALKEVYQAVYATGRFGDGLVPEVPPKREWVKF